MDFENALKHLAAFYTGQGFQVIVSPEQRDLPSFAKDFKVEILGKRGTGGVLVNVKKNRQEMEADKNLPRYADITNAQPGWRYDFALLDQESPSEQAARDAREPSADDVASILDTAEIVLRAGYVNPALVTAWSALEAVMRRKLRAVGEQTGLGVQVRTMLNTIYSTGGVSSEDFSRLEQVWKLRNEVVHGFTTQTVDQADVQFIIAIARQLLADTRLTKQPA